MSKSKRVIGLVIICALLFSFTLIISCEKNGTGSSVSFEAGEYYGTYSVERQYGIDLVLKLDTIKFVFTSGGVVTMKLVDTLDITGQSRDFCDITGEYIVSGNRFEISVSTIYSQTCDPLEIPEDKYVFYGRSGEIVFDGLDNDNQDFDRQIILWLPEE